MAHRGRLNVLAHILHKPYEVILAEFEGASRAEGAEDEGDVKYHQGYSYDFVTSHGRKMHLSLSPNPSHLELVNPVIEGHGAGQAGLPAGPGGAQPRRAPADPRRGRLHRPGHGGRDPEPRPARGLLERRHHPRHHRQPAGLHGPTPRETRFTRYATDIARQIEAPVFHVNADDPEQVVHAARLAIGFRQEYKRDVLIDLKCYRRHGHNVADDPTLTSPRMYQKIAAHPTATDLYARAADRGRRDHRRRGGGDAGPRAGGPGALPGESAAPQGQAEDQHLRRHLAGHDLGRPRLARRDRHQPPHP